MLTPIDTAIFIDGTKNCQVGYSYGQWTVQKLWGGKVRVRSLAGIGTRSTAAQAQAAVAVVADSFDVQWRLDSTALHIRYINFKGEANQIDAGHCSTSQKK